MAGKSFDQLSPADQAAWEKAGGTAESWNNGNFDAKYKFGKTAPTTIAHGKARRAEVQAEAYGSSHYSTQIGQEKKDEHNCQGNTSWTCKTENGVQTCKCE